MGKKKRGHPDVEEILSRPWCYYCERDFDDLKILISHQKAKHFKCDKCGRRLNTAGGLSVHLNQVHKETLTTVENALPNRNGLDVEIFGMEGIPEDVVGAHNQRVLSQFHQAEAERRAATGNPAPGTAGGSGPKKPKFESPSELKKRLAEHKAKKAAEQAAGISSGDATPIGAGQETQSPALNQSPGAFAGSPQYPPQHQHQQQLYGGPPSSYSSFPQSYGQQNTPFQQPQFPQNQQGFGSPGMPQFPLSGQQFSSVQQYPTPGGQPFPPHSQGGPPMPYGASSPSLPFQQHYQQPPRVHTPPQHNNSLPTRPGNLPLAPGLPQRPSFGAPSVNAFQMQQMHQGQVPGPPNPGFNYAANATHEPQGQFQQGGWNGEGMQTSTRTQGLPSSDSPVNGAADVTLANAESLDDLVSGAAKAAVPAPEPAAEMTTEKKNKKDKEKDKNTKLVYSDNEVSPEEKMANLPRYAFVPSRKEETVLGDATTAAVTGPVTGSDDVMDAQD
ncbi:MAG: hypothetical protein M1827_003819 [Pycnora praestabilis]|nr:MAG: hypothetical protein M1827_003819 [Pycnora praestabilis]